MNGLATLLAPPGDMPEVTGMAGRPPGSAETQADTDGFFGILQQMMGGSVQMASALSMPPVPDLQESGADGGSTTALSSASVQSTIPAAASSVSAEQPETPFLAASPPPGPSPPGKTEVVAPASSDPKGQGAAPQQQAGRMDTQEPRPGAIPLPIGLSQPDQREKATPSPQVPAAQPLASGKPGQAESEVSEKEVPATVKAEDGTAKTVVAAKPAAESEMRDGETAKNPFQHTQPQIGPVNPSSDRVESVPSRLPGFGTSLPPETARNVIDQVVKEAALQIRGETSEMRIKLDPASLGEGTLTVRMEGRQMQAQIDVSNAAVKAVLESNMGQLRDALGSRGIDVQRLDVYHSGQSLARDTGGDQGERYRRQGGKHHSSATDAIVQYDTGRLLGYNTMEVVM